MSSEKEKAQKRSAHMTDLIYNSLMYLVVVIILAVIAYFVSSWLWFIAAAAGWGIVLVGQAAYVFLWEAGGGDPMDDRETARKLSEESGKVSQAS